MKKFETPEIEVMAFETEDVMNASVVTPPVDLGQNYTPIT